jgi:hypothetical protein
VKYEHTYSSTLPVPLHSCEVYFSVLFNNENNPVQTNRVQIQQDQGGSADYKCTETSLAEAGLELGTVVCPASNSARLQWLLEQVIVVQLVRKLSAIYEVQMFTTVFAKPCHWIWLWATWILSTTPHTNPSRTILILFSHLCLGLPNFFSSLYPDFSTWLSFENSSRVPQTGSVHLLAGYLSAPYDFQMKLLYACYMSGPSHPPWFNDYNNISWVQMMNLLVFQFPPFSSCYEVITSFVVTLNILPSNYLSKTNDAKHCAQT